MFFAGFWELVIVGLIGLFMLAVPVAIAVAVVKITQQQQKNNPNLSPCPDCGNMVSIRAVSCPKCGCPAQTK